MQDTDLLTIGDCSIDLFMKVDTSFVTTDSEAGKVEICFFHGSKVPVDSFDTSIAGNACNVAVSCKKLGLNPTIYTELGDDANADRITDELQVLDIDTQFCIKNPNTPTNVHAIIVYGGDRTIFSYHEKRNYKLYDWPVPKWIFYSSLAQGFDDFQADLVDYINKNPSIAVAFNPGTQQLREGVAVLKNVLEVTDVLFVNEEEAEMLVGKQPSISTYHDALQGLGPKLTVITLGDKGSTAHDGATFEEMGVYEESRPVVDKTGAGDAYASGFLAALFHNKPLREAMEWGTKNASSVMRESGAVDGLLSLSDLEKE